jgi:aspartate/methionine/tyrosine aminotransferase
MPHKPSANGAAANGTAANGVSTNGTSANGHLKSDTSANGHVARRRAGTGPAHEPHAPDTTPDTTPEDARAMMERLRLEAGQRFRPEVSAGAAPIRVMALMVKETEERARRLGIPEAAIRTAVINRTIGDVDLRRVSATEDGDEYVSLADEVGVALPGELIGGRRATGATYRWIHARMLDFERALLARGFDLRNYDLTGTGNPILREMLAEYEAEHNGITLDPQLIYMSLGALDGLDKFWRGYAHHLRRSGVERAAVVFPAPSFNVPEWQAESLGLRLHRLKTCPEDHFKVTPAMLRQALAEAPDIRAFYLTVSNNPTAFAYSYDELRALFEVVLAADHEVMVVADLAYVGTADPDEDRRRMAAFADSGVLPRSVLVHSFSKTHSLTGNRYGWVGFADADLARAVGVGWTNSMATLPADWQLAYMAQVRLIQERPEISRRIRALYTHRRERLIAQLRHLNERHRLFAQVNLDDGGTVYNWSQLRPGQDVFSLFVATGIAGVPGAAFGYSDDFVRFSIGCVPVPAVQDQSKGQLQG